MLHKNTSQCKIPIVPEEDYFGQPKYSTPSKNILRCIGFFINATINAVLHALFYNYPTGDPIPRQFLGLFTKKATESVLITWIFVNFNKCAD